MEKITILCDKCGKVISSPAECYFDIRFRNSRDLDLCQKCASELEKWVGKTPTISKKTGNFEWEEDNV